MAFRVALRLMSGYSVRFVWFAAEPIDRWLAVSEGISRRRSRRL